MVGVESMDMISIKLASSDTVRAGVSRLGDRLPPRLFSFLSFLFLSCLDDDLGESS